MMIRAILTSTHFAQVYFFVLIFSTMFLFCNFFRRVDFLRKVATEKEIGKLNRNPGCVNSNFTAILDQCAHDWQGKMREKVTKA